MADPVTGRVYLLDVSTLWIGTPVLNQPPVASRQSLTTAIDTPVGITLGAVDDEGDTLSFNVVTQPSHGTLTGASPNLSYVPDAAFTGTDSFTIKAHDGCGDSNSATINITIDLLNDPPVCLAGGPYVGSSFAIPLDGNSATDPQGDSLTYLWTTDCPNALIDDPVSVSPLLVIEPTCQCSLDCTVTLTVSDGTESRSCTSTVVLEVGSNVEVISDPPVLWSPNHEMVAVTLSIPSVEGCPESATGQIVTVSSNEPTEGLGDGDMTPDWEVTGDLTVNLRAERSGLGDGREYTITVDVTDACGIVSPHAVTVLVPSSAADNTVDSLIAVSQCGAGMAGAVTLMALFCCSLRISRSRRYTES